MLSPCLFCRLGSGEDARELDHQRSCSSTTWILFPYIYSSCVVGSEGNLEFLYLVPTHSIYQSCVYGLINTIKHFPSFLITTASLDCFILLHIIFNTKQIAF